MWEQITNQLFSECGILAELLLIVVVIEGLALRFLFKKFLEVLKDNNELIAKLVERVKEHD
jgi:hypothetical protein